MAEVLVLDASALVDLLLRTELADAVARRTEGCSWFAPAHLDAEVLSAVGRLARAGTISSDDARTRLGLFVELPITRRPVAPLLLGAWGRRADLRLVDALYVELAAQLGAPLVTTDLRLARATPRAEAVVR